MKESDLLFLSFMSLLYALLAAISIPHTGAGLFLAITVIAFLLFKLGEQMHALLPWINPAAVIVPLAVAIGFVLTIV